MLTPQVIIGNKFVESVIPLINEARYSIDIIVYDWRIYPNAPNHPVSRFNVALSEALKRAVTVRALVNNKQVRDFLISLGIKAKTINSTKILHAKSMLIDGQISVCGSHNYTQGGMVLNHEISLAVDLGTPDNILNRYFNDLYGNF